MYAHPSWYARLSFTNGYIDHPKTESNIDRSSPRVNSFQNWLTNICILADHIKYILYLKDKFAWKIHIDFNLNFILC